MSRSVAVVVVVVDGEVDEVTPVVLMVLCGWGVSVAAASAGVGGAAAESLITEGGEGIPDVQLAVSTAAETAELFGGAVLVNNGVLVKPCRGKKLQ